METREMTPEINAHIQAMIIAVGMSVDLVNLVPVDHQFSATMTALGEVTAALIVGYYVMPKPYLDMIQKAMADAARRVIDDFESNRGN